MIPVACAGDIDDSNLASDDSIDSNENLAFEDLSIEDGDSSDDNSLAVKEEDINKDKKSKNGIQICVCHFFVVILHSQNCKW